MSLMTCCVVVTECIWLSICASVIATELSKSCKVECVACKLCDTSLFASIMSSFDFEMSPRRD